MTTSDTTPPMIETPHRNGEAGRAFSAPIGSGFRVYHQEAAVTIYHGDCREVLPTLGRHDLLLTDPPYGIGRVWKGGFKNGWQKSSLEIEQRNEWDVAAPEIETLDAAIALCNDAVIWGGNYFPLPPSRGWLVWVKPERNFTLSEAELAWTSKDTIVRVYESARHVQGREHPTQKPLELMLWCISKFDGVKTILDPFAGSGTTGRAAKDLGMKAILIEREERYCEIAAKRLSQDVLPLGIQNARMSDERPAARPNSD